LECLTEPITAAPGFILIQLRARANLAQDPVSGMLAFRRHAPRPPLTMAFHPNRWFYPLDWSRISARVRFETAGPHGAACCWHCGRPHGRTVRCLPDGRWFDTGRNIWRDGGGQPADWPDIIAFCRARTTRVILAAAHLDHDPGNNRPRNLKALCQRCHLLLDRPRHRALARLTILRRRAAGDLFLGTYSHARLADLAPVLGLPVLRGKGRPSSGRSPSPKPASRGAG
jgi:hypothetical protein